MRPALPSGVAVLVDQEGSATIPFNEWCSWVDGQMVSLGIGADGRAGLPPGTIVKGGKGVDAYSRWLGWIDRSLVGYGSPPKRAPLPPSNLVLVGSDRKATIPFAIWLQYVDGLLG